MSKSYYLSPVGTLEITANDKGITGLNFVSQRGKSAHQNAHMKKCLAELEQYFKGARKRFTVNLVLEGTEFQKKVWRALLTIPYGKTASYLDIARLIGNKNAMRAVGGANHRNPVAIIVPCHRVIAHDGSLGGYGGGLPNKEWLLAHERKIIAGKC
ncbi:MAG: methylated-DNA--[protein]-cysteine S-methyltransferase [Bacteroidota bacterium]